MSHPTNDKDLVFTAVGGTVAIIAYTVVVFRVITLLIHTS